MNYELAKELKEAGFPQKHGRYLEYWDEGGGVWNCGDEPVSTYRLEELIYNPTLEELIEACGDDFDELKAPHHRQQEGYPEFDEWWAEATIKTGICTKGKTRKEAVARLWLALNKK